MKQHTNDFESTDIPSLAVELHLVAGALSRRLREQGSVGDLTAAQKSVLLRLERDGPATGTALARVEGMRPQSMGAIIAALETAGHVVGTADPADGRQTIVALTEQFRDWIGTAREARQDWLQRTLKSRLSPQEQQQLAGAVDLLKRLLHP